MKTPREIILDRHRDVEPKLIAVSQSVLDGIQSIRDADASVPARSGPGPTWIVRFVAGCWRELFLPCRTIWISLATAWILLIGITLLIPAEREARIADEQNLTPEFRNQLQLQYQLRAALLNSHEMPAETNQTGAGLFHPRRPHPINTLIG